MGADRTLVDAAFKEATSRAESNVINMKPLYDSNTANVNKVFETISGALGVYGAKKEKNRVGVRKQMAAFQAQADELVQGMYAQDEPLPDAFINAFRDKITSLQDEFEAVNTYGKGDTSENSAARNRIMGELTRVKNKATNFRAGTEISLAALKDVDTDNKDRKNVAAHMQAFDFENYEQLVADGKIKVMYGENGIEITTNNYNKEKVTFKGMLPEDGKFISGGGYSGEDVTITLASFQKDFKPINIEGHTAILEDINNATLLGEEFGNKQGANISDYNEEEYNAVFTDHVDTEDKFKNVVSSKIKGIHEIKSSFKTSLEKNIEIPLSALSNMYFDDNNDGVNDMDLLIEQLNIAGGKGSDGSINAEDLAAGEGNAMFEQNMDALIDALTNIDHPAFDIGLSAPMLGAYLGEINKNRYNTAFEKSKKARIKNNEGGPEPTKSMVLESYRTFESQDNILNIALDGGILNSWNGYEWIPDPDKPGNYKNIGTDETYPLGNLLRGRYFGLGDRIIKRNLPFKSSFPEDLDTTPNKEEKEIKVSNTKPSINGVIYPPRSITSSTGGASQANIKSLTQLYTDKYGVAFSKSGSNILMTGPDDETQLVEMNRYNDANNMESQDIIQQFVLKYVK